MSELIVDATAVRSLRGLGDKNSNCVAEWICGGWKGFHVRLFCDGEGT
jgi:hypothetical protein